MGNLGQWVNKCTYFGQSDGIDVNLFCPFGYVESLEMFAIADPAENSCPDPAVDGYDSDPFQYVT